MISNRHISKITLILVAVTLVLCILAVGYSQNPIFTGDSSGYSVEYAEKLFGKDEIIEVDIEIDEDSWAEMLENATKEEYYKCDVVINGETFKSVGIRTKGNTSLSSIAKDPDNDRYSFKLEFDHYVGGQTCFGLDKLILNNNYADTTNMKEAIVYDMFEFLDADASLYNYAKISVNGEYWGVYLALEAVEDSFMLRNYGTQRGYLYKPEGMDGGGGGEKGGGNDKKDFSPPARNDGDQKQGDEKERKAPNNEGGGFGGGMPPNGGGFGGGSGGANLNYSDDALSSYSTIWDGEVNESKDSDHKRVVEALKNISEGNELEKYADVDNILKYMAVHNFSVNEDSLSGSMAHNYYLYESDGKLNIIPWDYNLAFGGMNSKNASDVINDPIDDSYSSTDFFDFVLENEEYRELYHKYYQKLVDEYVSGGKFEETYNRIRARIDELVKTDPNAMYSYEQYEKGAETLYRTVELRGESVNGQLSGAIPSTSEHQRENSESLITASDINISDMGQFMGGGHGR